MSIVKQYDSFSEKKKPHLCKNMPSLFEKVSDILSRFRIRFTSSCCSSTIVINEGGSTHPVDEKNKKEPTIDVDVDLRPEEEKKE